MEANDRPWAHSTTHCTTCTVIAQPQILRQKPVKNFYVSLKHKMQSSICSKDSLLVEWSGSLCQCLLLNHRSRLTSVAVLFVFFFCIFDITSILPSYFYSCSFLTMDSHCILFLFWHWTLSFDLFQWICKLFLYFLSSKFADPVFLGGVADLTSKMGKTIGTFTSYYYYWLFYTVIWLIK